MPVYHPKYWHFTPQSYGLRELPMIFFLEPNNKDISAKHALYSISILEVAFTLHESSNIMQKFTVGEMK